MGQLIDSEGKIVTKYEYDSYGNVISSDGSVADENPIRWSTKYWDDETGLGYWGHRHYASKFGKWTNRDPIGDIGSFNYLRPKYFDVREEQNLYRYCRNNPTNLIDPTGQLPIVPVIVGVWAVVEFCLTASDAVSTAQTVLDDEISTNVKILAVGTFAAGIVSPGGGGSTALRKVSKLKLSKDAKRFYNQGKVRQALDTHYEDIVRRKTGGKSKIVDGHEVDSVTDQVLIEAKRSYGAIDSPSNWLRKHRDQIKRIIKSAEKRGNRAEFWFKYGVDPKIKKYIEKKGGTVKIGLGE